MNNVSAAAGRATATDATAQVSDALVFIAYFGSALVAGGVAYDNAYNLAFQFNIRSTAELLQAADDFCVEVLWNAGFWWLAVCFVVGFACLFYAARFLWRLFFGYLTLAFLILLTFLGCVVLGDNRGRADALRDRASATTTLPLIKLYVDGKNVKNDDSPDAEFDSGDFHLLAISDGRLLVFVPADDPQSMVTVTALRRDDVVRYEVGLR